MTTFAEGLREEARFQRDRHQNYLLASELNDAADELERLTLSEQALRNAANGFKERAEAAEATLQKIWKTEPDWSMAHEIITKYHHAAGQTE